LIRMLVLDQVGCFLVERYGAGLLTLIVELVDEHLLVGRLRFCCTGVYAKGRDHLCVLITWSPGTWRRVCDLTIQRHQCRIETGAGSRVDGYPNTETATVGSDYLLPSGISSNRKCCAHRRRTIGEGHRWIWRPGDNVHGDVGVGRGM